MASNPPVLNSDDLLNRMLAAGRALSGDIWAQIEDFAIPELRKIVVQLEAIAEHLDKYTLEGAKILVEMQVDAAVSVIVAMTSMLRLAVENAVNAILDAVRDFVNGALGIVLL